MPDTKDTQSKIASTDLIVLLLACVFLVLPSMGYPGMQYLSGKLGPQTDMSQDAFQGLMAGVSSLLVLALFVIRSTWHGGWVRIVKIVIVCLLSFIYIALPTLSDVMARREMGIQSNGSPVSFAHDGGVLQTEAAVKFLLKGVSPYSADYRKTEMAQGVDSRPELWQSLGFDENPAFDFYPYPPFTLILTAPFYLIWNAVFGWYDQRILHILALIFLGIIGYKLPRSEKWKLPLMSIMVLSPMSALYFILGMNDVLCLSFIVASIFMLTREKTGWSALLLGLACGLKQFAWILVPFYLVYIYSQMPESEKRWKRTLGLTWPLFASFAIIMLPFLIWDPKGMVHSLITAQGSIYPFRSSSLGFSNFMIFFQWIYGHRASYPGLLYYLIFVMPVMLFGLKKVAREKTLPTTIIWYTATLFLFLFFSRNFAHNYLGLIVSMVALAFVMENDKSADI